MFTKNAFCGWLGADYAASPHTAQKSTPTDMRNLFFIYFLVSFTGIFSQEPPLHEIHIRFLDEHGVLVTDTNRFEMFIFMEGFNKNALHKQVVHSYTSNHKYGWNFWTRWRPNIQEDRGLGFHLYDFRIYFVDKLNITDTMIINVLQTDSIPVRNKPYTRLCLPPFQKATFEVCALDNVKINHNAVKFYNQYAKRYEYQFENADCNPTSDKPGIWDITPQMWLKKE